MCYLTWALLMQKAEAQDASSTNIQGPKEVKWLRSKSSGISCQLELQSLVEQGGFEVKE